MEVGGRTGLDQALALVEAMKGRDDATRVSLWRAALRYRTRDNATPQTGDNRLGGRARALTGRARLAHEGG